MLQVPPFSDVYGGESHRVVFEPVHESLAHVGRSKRGLWLPLYAPGVGVKVCEAGVIWSTTLGRTR